MPYALPRLVVGLALLPLAGCDSNDSPPPSASPSNPAPPKVADTADPEQTEPDSSAETPPEMEAPAAADAKDAAFFVVRDRGIVTLTDAGFGTVPGSERVYLSEFKHGADGKLYGRTSGDIMHIQTGAMTSAAPLDFKEVGSIAGFDVGAKGELWAVGSLGVAEYRDGAWQTYSKSDVGLGDDFAVGIAIDATGEPWAATSGSLVRRQQGKWEPAALPRGKTKYLDQMGRGPDQEVYLSTYSVLFRLTGTPDRVKVKKGSYDDPGKFSFAESTFGVAVVGLENASIFLPEDQAVRFQGRKDLGVGNISSVSVDTQGRVWAAGEGGVAIAGPGDARVTWRSGSMEPVAGQISTLIVRGRGPSLPEAGDVKKGGLRGRIMKDGAGVAEVKIELCESPSMVYSRTPCTGAPTHLRGKTDAEGNFAFDDVPLGAYGIAVKSGRKWQITLGAALGTKMTEGATYDIGSLELD